MKTTISLIVFLACLTMYLPGQDIADDVYFKPGDSQDITQRALVKSPKPNYKNGAKEIIYLDSNSNKDLVVTNDSIYILGEMNDSIAVAENGDEDYNDEEGYYLNDFKGSASDLEYAERIRRFHNPKFTIHISDPQYTDIYFLDDDYWNVYVDGSYAWVTPTWTNPFWDNYFWRPYSYNSWYWRNSWYSPYSYYSSWYGNPWYGGGYYGNYYNGWGGYYGAYYGGYYGGLYGWGNQYYPYYNDYWNYNPYYWGGYSWSGGTTSRNKNYDEANRRKEYYSSTTRANNINTTRISGGSYSPAVTRSGVTSGSVRGEREINSSVTVNRPSTSISRGSANGNALVRSNNSRGSGITSGINTRTRTMYNTDMRASERSAFNNSNTNVRVDGIRSGNTVPSVRSTTSAPATRSSATNSSGSTVRYGTGTSAIRSYESSPSVRSSSSSAPVRSSSSSSSYTPSSSSSSSSYSNSRSSSTPSYSTPSSSSSSSRSSGSSYSGGSSSSRSSGGSSGGRR